jgi:hypothetical protein
MKKLLLIILSLLLALSLACCNLNDNTSDKESSADNDIENVNINSDKGEQEKSAADEKNNAPSSDAPTSSNNDTKKEEKMDSFVLKGIVKCLNTHLEIEVIESDYAFGIYWVIVPNNTPILDKNGNNIELSSLSEGDIVNITYNGQTMMSYPPQIVALKIEKSDK